MAHMRGQYARYGALDGYRFLAASAVAISHYVQMFDLSLGKLVVESLSAFVDFFFVLSGFVIATSYADRISNIHDYRSFLQARLARIYPLHFATLVVSASIVPLSAMFHIEAIHPEVTAWSGLPGNLALIHAWGFYDHLTFNGVSWSISAE